MPTQVIFNPGLPAVLRDTLLQLIALAWSNAMHELPPVSYAQLAGLTGKSIPTLHGHFAVLRKYHAALRSRSAGNGLFIVTLEDWLFVQKPEVGGDSKFLESPVKGSDQDHTDQEEEEDPPPPSPPDPINDSGRFDQKTRIRPEPGLDSQATAVGGVSSPKPPAPTRLPKSVEDELVQAGIYSFLLPEVARAGWKPKDLIALLVWCEADRPEKPGGLFMVRLRKRVRVPDRYYGKRCVVCRRVGKHADGCNMAYADGID